MRANRIFHLLNNTGRAFGRTEAMLKGAENTPGCVVVCANSVHRKDIERRSPGIKTISLDDVDKLRGLHCPIVFDHFALQYLWGLREKEAESAMAELRRSYDQDESKK